MNMAMRHGVLEIRLLFRRKTTAFAASVQRLVAPSRNGSSPNRDSALSAATSTVATDTG